METATKKTWQTQHNDAMIGRGRCPKHLNQHREAAMVHLLRAMEHLHEAHNAEGRGAAEDCVAAPLVHDIARATHRLLDFDCGRIDSGSYQGELSALLDLMGFPADALYMGADELRGGAA